MRYALLVYDDPSAWEKVSTQQKQALHDEYHAVAGSPGMIGHYRIRQPQMMETVRVDDDQTVTTEGTPPSREDLRAVFLIECEHHDSVLEIAARIPAARMGGAVEVWPLTAR